jgi:glycosyltransferase involved in cell wall biosynthesis
MPRRILYLQPSYTPPSVDPEMDRFSHLSAELEGDVVQPVWWARPEQVEEVFGPGSYPVFTRGRFRYHWYLAWQHPPRQRRLRASWFLLRKGWEIYRQRGFDCIVAYSHMTNGLLGVLLKWLTGARLVIEIATSPHLIWLTGPPNWKWRNRFRQLYSDILLQITVRQCDRVRLLYAKQLDHYRSLRDKASSVFHEYVAMVRISRGSPSDEQFVYFVGAPWYLKGVDVLIEAFQRLSTEFSQVRLVLQGHFTSADRHQLEHLIGGNPAIQMFRAVPNEELLEQMRKATVFVLPSRCEGWGRVIAEAMGAGVPVIGSDAGGIPFLVRHGETGFVVPAGDSKALEERLRELLLNEGLRSKLGDRAYEIAHAELTESEYVRHFAAMVAAAVQGGA